MKVNVKRPTLWWSSAYIKLLIVTALLTVLVQFALPTSAVTTTPSTMNFQGRLTNSSGSIMADGLYNMKFRIYDASSGGTLKWTEVRETTNRVQVTNGLFSVQLGQVTPLDPSIFVSGSLYFEIELPSPGTITCTTASCATYSEGPMTPRNKLSTSAYAFNSETLDGIDSAGFIHNTTSPQTANFNITGTGTASALQAASLDTTTAGTLTIGGANATGVAIVDNVTVGAGLTITMAGGDTAGRPVAPAEGMMYYDTSTKKLLVYANGKWQADRSTSTIIVGTSASGGSSGAVASPNTDGADYVNASATSAQTTINSALTALGNAGGGTLYLMEGTYIVDGPMSVPSNVTISGSGSSTVVKIKNDSASYVTMFDNSDQENGNSHITFRSFVLDGNQAGSAEGGGGIYFTASTGGLTHISIESMDIRNFIGTAVSVSASYGKFMNNTVQSNDTGISLYDNLGPSGSGVDWVVSGNQFMSNGGTSLSASLVNSIISGNSFSDNSQYSTDLSYGYGVTIANNTYSNGKALTLSQQTDTIIVGNTVTDSGAYGFDLFSNVDRVTIADNIIMGTAGTTGIRIGSESEDNRISGNYISGFANNISDSGTGTIYANQLDSSGQLISSGTTFKLSSSTAFKIQNTAATETYFAANTTGNQLKIGNSSASTGADVTLLILDGATSSISPTGVAGAMYYDTTNNKFKCYTTTWVDCDTTGGASGANTSLSNLASTNINAALNATANNLTLQTTTSGNIVLNSAGTIELQDDTNIAGNVTIGAAKTLRLVGGDTASRPASPSEGMMYFDTTTKQLLTYAGGKWQGDSKSATFIVAASNSPQVSKDGAQYVANGEDSAGAGIGTLDGDQVQINAALSAAGSAGGGVVYLAEGTYTIDASISIPNNVTLAGSGNGTVIQLGNFGSTSVTIKMITNTDTSTGTGVKVRDLKIDGRRSINTAGYPTGISFNNMGAGTGSTARLGAEVSNVRVVELQAEAIYFEDSSNNIVANTSTMNAYNGISFNCWSDSSNNNTITGNVSQNHDSWGIYICDDNNTVTGNVVQDNGDVGIITNGSYNTITGNTSRDNSNSGIMVASGDNNTVSGNVVANNYQGITVQGSSSLNNTISGNTIMDSGGATANNGIYLSNADYTTVTSNTISDASATTNNYAINVNGAGVASTYLADNTLGGGSIFDTGTGTIYANQLNASGQLINSASGGMAVKLVSGSTNDLFQAQNSSGTALMKVTSAGVIQAASFDTAAAGALTIGSTNATSIVLSQNSSIASGKTFLTQGDTTVKTTSANAFQVQNAGGTALLSVDTSGNTVTVGSASNGVIMSASGVLFAGTARTTQQITLSPEFTGATFTGDGGGDNNGTLTSDFCSGTSRVNINNTMCGATESHNYYNWTTTQASAQDYDIWVRYQMPSDYDTGSMTNLAIWGRGTTATELVTAALYAPSSSSPCATTSDAVASVNTWAQGTSASPLGACTINAGDIVTIRVTVRAGQNNHVKAGEITFSYRGKF